MHIIPYNAESKSAKRLAKSLGIKRIRAEGSRYMGAPHKSVINWGCSILPQEVMKSKVINPAFHVHIASNKLSAFHALGGSDVKIPQWTCSKKEALELVREQVVVCRTVLSGHSGAGIVLAKSPDEVVDAPLYVVYVPKQDEYRIHVGDYGNSIIDVQRKAIAPNVDRKDVNFQIRNHANGFIYVRNNVNPPEKVLTNAKECVRILGLNFGAVDVIWNKGRKEAYVLEVNTAPGLEGTTLDNYVKYFKRVGE